MSHPPPKLVLLIRHGEKPTDKSDPDLSPAGRARAQMLAREIPKLYPALSVLFAAARSKDSNRPLETIEPLGAALGIRIDDAFAVDDHKKLAKYILHDSPGYAGKTLLICWHHEKIPALATDLGVTDAPSPWPNNVFDRIWEFAYSPEGAVTLTIREQPQV
jgi:hypothetical protein